MRLPVCLALSPASSVPGDSVNEFVMPDILRALVGITAARARGSNECEPDGVVVRLIGSVLAIGQDGGAELAFHVSQVNPLVRRHFEFLRLGRWTLDRPYIPVVRRHLIRGSKRKCRFQIRFPSIPVDHVRELHEPARVPRREADGLHETRARGFPRHLDSYARRAAFHHSNLRRTADVRSGRRLLLVPIHIPGRPLLRIVIGNRKARRGGQQFPVNRLVENTGDVAIGV